jgi:hypothetical protein
MERSVEKAAVIQCDDESRQQGAFYLLRVPSLLWKIRGGPPKRMTMFSILNIFISIH